MRRHLVDKPQERASLLSASQPHASLWLTALPTEPQFRLRNGEMRAALRLRLHLPPKDPHELRTTACPCGAGDLNVDALHFHSCEKLRRTAITKRHDLVLKAAAVTARELHVPYDVEPRPAYIAANSNQPSREKPDLRFIVPYHRVVELYSDVAVTHPAAPSYALHGAADHELHAAKRREAEKKHKYGHLAKQGVSEFQAFALETLGAWGPQADSVLKTLFKHSQHENEVDVQNQMHEARTRISVALQRGNALVHRAGIELICSLRDVRLPLPPHLRVRPIGRPRLFPRPIAAVR
jgi:hypothetical protein